MLFFYFLDVCQSSSIATLAPWNFMGLSCKIFCLVCDLVAVLKLYLSGYSVFFILVTLVLFYLAVFGNKNYSELVLILD